MTLPAVRFFKNTLLKKTTATLLLLFFLLSCGTDVGTRRSEVRYFDTGFSATVVNTAFKVKGRSRPCCTCLKYTMPAQTAYTSASTAGKNCCSLTPTVRGKKKRYSVENLPGKDITISISGTRRKRSRHLSRLFTATTTSTG